MLSIWLSTTFCRFGKELDDRTFFSLEYGNCNLSNILFYRFRSVIGEDDD